MTRYIDADALIKALPATFQSTASLKTQIVSLIGQQLTVAPIQPPAPLPGSAPAYRTNKAVVFNAPYSDASNWTNGKTSAYPGYGVAVQSQANPGDSKLDWISPTHNRPTDDGLFMAALKSSGLWDTQLVTTEGSPKGFTVQTGDVVVCDFTPPAQNGAWPALWTWLGPGGEVDLFEYHGDNPTTIELTNHVRPSKPDYPKILTPGTPAHIEVVLGGLSVDWYVDGVLVFQDGQGIGPNFKAYLIANLSVQAANQYHPGPTAGVTVLSARIANVTVFR